MHMHVAARTVEEYLDGALNPQQKPAVIQLLPLMAPSEVGDVPSEKSDQAASRAGEEGPVDFRCLPSACVAQAPKHIEKRGDQNAGA
jgi:hypothetical protein